jgi:antirestriction protein ArdC
MTESSKTKDRIKEITDNLEQGIRDLFESGRYMDYLRSMSRFHRYSLNNTVLIYMQHPDATLVSGFNKWRDQFGRNVKRGEKGIKIIAPTPYKIKKEMEKFDPVTRAPMLDSDGKVVMEEVEIKIPMYRVVSVFDVSQTEGRPLPQLAENLSGDVREYGIFLDALKLASPVPIAFEAMEPGTDGYFSQEEKRIAIRTGMSEVQTVSAAIHEITHARLHDYSVQQLAAARGDENVEPRKPKERRTEEVEAESVSYAVCQYYGIQTAANSFGYIASWSKGKELPELRASLETINETASGLIEEIDKQLAVLQKEQEKAQTVPAELENAAISTGQEEMAHALEVPEFDSGPAGYPMPDPAMSLAARNAYSYTDDDMLPLSKERAVELYEKDMTVYTLDADNGAGMAFDRADIDTHTGLFGVPREEWEQTREYQQWKDKNKTPENYLETAEKSTEQNYDRLDGLINNQPPDSPTVAELEAQAKAGEQISLTELARAVSAERPSVVEQLKTRPEPVKTASSRKQEHLQGAEMER